MNKQSKNLGEEELLKRVGDLIDGKTNNQKFTDSFLRFCSRLFSVRPKTGADFQLSLKQELLKKHPAYFEKEVEFRMEKLNTMNRIKRFALVGVPALVIALIFVLAMGITPQKQIANAMEVMANDPQVRSVIEEYNLEVQEVETRDNIAYIFLNQQDSLEVTITVNLEDGTIGKIVTGEYDTTKKSMTKKSMDKEGVEKYNKGIEAKAEIKDMTVEEFKKHLIEQRKAKRGMFKARAEACGKTSREFKAGLIEQYKVKAEARGMTLNEFRMHLAEQKKAKYEAFEAKAEANGMTVDEYRKHLGEQTDGENVKKLQSPPRFLFFR